MSLKISERPVIEPTPVAKPRLTTPVPVPGSALPTVHLRITVTNFRSLLLPARNKTVLTEHRIELLTEHQNVSIESEKDPMQPPGTQQVVASMTNAKVSLAAQKADGNMRTQQTLKVKNEGAVLRFKITDESLGSIYRPIAITFARIGAKKKAAVHWNSGNQTGAYTPFSLLQLNGPTLQITDTLPPVISTRKKRVRYKFSILIQNQTTGDLGLIDPTLDNDNDWVDPDNEGEPECGEEGEEE